jgi:hypothetical protein
MTTIPKGVRAKSRRTIPRFGWRWYSHDSTPNKRVAYGGMRHNSHTPAARESASARADASYTEDNLTSCQLNDLRVRAIPPDPWDDQWSHNEKCWKRQRKTQYKL